MREFKIRISVWSLLFGVMLLSYLEPLLFKEYSLVDDIFTILKIISFLTCSIMYLRKNKVNYFIVLIALFQLCLLISTIANGGDIVRCIGPMVAIIGICMLAEIYDAYYGFVHFMKIVNGIYILFFIINIITLIIYYPDGIIRINMTQHYFLGIENRFVFVFLPLCAFKMICDVVINKKITFSSWLMYGICLLNLLYVWAVGSFLGFICFGVLLILSINIKIGRYINSIVCSMAIIVINILLVLFNIQNLLSGFIVNVLGKDIGLTNRTFLWGKALALFAEHPILGVGVRTIKDSYVDFGNIRIAHAHNLFVNYLYQGGIIYLVLFITIMFICVKKLYVYRDKLVAKVLVAALFASFIISLADVYDSVPFWLLVMACYKIDALVKLESNIKGVDK